MNCKCGFGLRRSKQVPFAEINLMASLELNSISDLTLSEARRVEKILNDKGIEVDVTKNLDERCFDHWHIEIKTNQPMALVEVTDTYGGEANYSWVRKYKFPCFSLSDVKIVKKAKELAEWTGLKGNTEKFGDMIKVKPRNICQVMFITFE